MCVDLHQIKGRPSSKGWSLEFYSLCKKLTKYQWRWYWIGLGVEYTWREALAANRGSLFQGRMLKLTAPEVQRSLEAFHAKKIGRS